MVEFSRHFEIFSHYLFTLFPFEITLKMKKNIQKENSLQRL